MRLRRGVYDSTRVGRWNGTLQDPHSHGIVRVCPEGCPHTVATWTFPLSTPDRLVPVSRSPNRHGAFNALRSPLDRHARPYERQNADGASDTAPRAQRTRHER